MSLGYPDQGPAYVTNVNYPMRSPSNLVLRSAVTCPTAHNIRVAVPLDEGELEQQCGDTFLEMEDPYKLPMKTWRFCKFSAAAGPEAFTFIQSYLNILKFRQVTGNGGEGLLFKLALKCVRDEDIALKVMQIERMLNGTRQMAFDSRRPTAAAPQQLPCDDNLCFNGGRCVDPGPGAAGVTGGGGCACVGHFAGRHCLETVCDARPCQNGGECSLTSTGFACECAEGFRGATCRQRARPCFSWPCGRHGICEETNEAEGFRCKCHLWWSGKQGAEYLFGKQEGWNWNTRNSLHLSFGMFPHTLGERYSVSDAELPSSGKKEHILSFCSCCTADSQTDAGRHQLYNTGSLVLFSTACELHDWYLSAFLG